MFFSDLSIKRPIFATVMMLALVTLGIFSYRRLPIDMYPDVEIPVLSIVTKFPGASPETVEREVTKADRRGGQPHLRRQARHLRPPGRASPRWWWNSTWRSGSTRPPRRPGPRSTPSAAISPRRSKSRSSRSSMFPPCPIVSLAVRSERLSPRELTTLVEKKVKRRFENISGVGKVDLVGESKREVNVN